MKLMPGVRLNFSKSGVGMSVGVPGARVSFSPTGRVTRTLGIPGTGLYDVASVGSSSSRRRSNELDAFDQEPDPSPPHVEPLPGRPGVFASREAKQFWAAVNEDRFDDVVALAAQHEPSLLVGFHAAQRLAAADRTRDAVGVLRPLWTGPFAFDFDRDFAAYGSDRRLQFGIARGVSALLDLDGTAVGLLLVEMLQEIDEFEVALTILETLPHTQVTLLSEVDLLVALERWPEVLEASDAVTNSDDATALILAYRAVAFRETGSLVASQECFAAALRARSRAMEVRHYALSERALLRVAQGQRSKALADIERIRAEDHDSELATSAEARIAALSAAEATPVPDGS